MKKIPFSQAEFVASAILEESWPELRNIDGAILPEIAIIGRSNVGKSSLINHLLSNKKLARVSATPGKTQTLNFFIIDKALALVDLPGYGFAKVFRGAQTTWAKAIDLYLKKRTPLKLLLLLIDIRRVPTDEDLQFLEWAHYHQKPLLLVLTKTDKLNASEIKLQEQAILKDINLPHVRYSVKDIGARKNLIDTLNRQLHGTH